MSYRHNMFLLDNVNVLLSVESSWDHCNVGSFIETYSTQNHYWPTQQTHGSSEIAYALAFVNVYSTIARFKMEPLTYQWRVLMFIKEVSKQKSNGIFCGVLMLGLFLLICFYLVGDIYSKSTIKNHKY